MIRVSNHIWIGDSTDEEHADLKGSGIHAILNVALDLKPTRGWDEIDYAHIGLIDGPGNRLTIYCSAILALDTLLDQEENVLICCHTAGRSLAVVVMYMQAISGELFPNLPFLAFDRWLSRFTEFTDISLPSINKAHIQAFKKMPWSELYTIMYRKED